MFKTAIDKSEDILNNPPTRTEESVAEFVANLKQAQRDLKAEFNDPRTRMGDRDVTKIASTLAEVEMKLPEAERILEAIRNEFPQEELIEDNGEEGLDVQASVEKLAVAVASQSVGQNSWHRMASGLQAFEENIEPLLVPAARDWPKQKFSERLAELIAMPHSKLAEETKKQFPTDEWIGKEPEPVGGEGDLGYIPTHFEKDETTKPESKDSDGEFESALDKERKFRGINKAEGNSGGKQVEKKAADSDYPGANNSAGRSNDNLKEPANSGDGAMLQAEPPKAEDAFEKEIESEQNKGQGAPRGPNRRLPKDVNAYSTPSNKLTAAAKLAEMFENMTEKQALEIVLATIEEKDSKDDDFIAKPSDKSTDQAFEDSKNDDDKDKSSSEDEKTKESKVASIEEEISLEGLFDV